MKNRRLALALGIWTVALFSLLSLATDLFGLAGEALSTVLVGLLGALAWASPPLFALAGAAVLRRWSFSAFQAFADTVLLVTAAALAHLASDGSGGILGEWIGDAAQVAFGSAGAVLVALALAGLWVLVRTPVAASAKSLFSTIESWREAPEWAEVPSADEDAAEVEEDELLEEQSHEPRGARVAEAVIPSAEAGEWVSPKSSSGLRKKSVVAEFTLPSTSLLAPTGSEDTGADEDLLQEEGRLLVSTLGAYDVDAKLEDAVAGPTITTFEVTIAAGTKLSKVIGLSDDLSLAFGRKVRVVPGRLGRVAFEVPSEHRAAVGLRELLEDDRFRAARETMALPVVLGRDARGEGVYADLAEMPHVLAAGATGAGKSVGLNVMLASLLYARTPEELRLVMVDPKVVELQPYARIPHMLLPVVTDMGKAALALRWAVDEMEGRYQLLARAGCKNIETYNERAGAGHKLSRIVIVIDEWSDLFASQGKSVEALVSRLAQKARAAGMHIILATQRPSVDVITGVIKANFPTRVAYRVAQRVDSRVVLDEQGAEQLAGRGDMLVKMNGSDALLRAQCPMISEVEIEALTGYLCTQGMPDYDESILDPVPALEKKPGGRKGVSAKVLS